MFLDVLVKDENKRERQLKDNPHISRLIDWVDDDSQAEFPTQYGNWLKFSRLYDPLSSHNGYYGLG